MSKLHAGLDVGDYATAICIVEDGGAPIFEGVTETNPSAIDLMLRPYRRRLGNVGQEAGNRSVWLHRELSRLKYPMRTMNAYHAHGLLKSNLNKTDVNDARGLALLLAKGLYRSTHVKSDQAFKLSILLTMREAAMRKTKDLDRTLGAAAKRLGGNGADNGRRAPCKDTQANMEVAIREIAEGAEEMRARYVRIDKLVSKIASEDPVCNRLMTVPGIGPITALTFKVAIDDPTRFASSRVVAAYLGLTPRVFQSGVSTRSGGISRRGNSAVRKTLFMAARSLVSSSRSGCSLRKWAVGLAKAKGNKTAYIACARKMAVLLHHLWVTGQEFDPAR